MAKILIVDDEKENIELLKRRLRKFDFEFLEADNAIDAILQAETHIPQLILMDLKMPNMDGYEAIERLRALEPTKQIPIIALTCFVMPGDRERAISAGANEYETKPMDWNQLVEKINRLLQS